MAATEELRVTVHAADLDDARKQLDERAAKFYGNRPFYRYDLVARPWMSTYDGTTELYEVDATYREKVV